MSGQAVIGPEIDMEDPESGAVSARVNLDLNLAPPLTRYTIIGSGVGGEGRRIGLGVGQEARQIWPRFGPGIHGVFLDLQSESEPPTPSFSFQTTAGFAVPVEQPPLDFEHGLERRIVVTAGQPQLPPLDQTAVEMQREMPPQPRSTREQFHLLFELQREMERRPGPTVQRVMRRFRPTRAVREGPTGVGSSRGEVQTFPSQPEERGARDVNSSALLLKAGGESSNSENFECNICLEMASEPVLTPCGHLFCWPCLYRWLYLHSFHKECPVCKGGIAESTVTPIYGRGSGLVTSGPNSEDGAPRVPPRPQAHRVESVRQQRERDARERERQDMEALRTEGRLEGETVPQTGRAMPEGFQLEQQGREDGVLASWRVSDEMLSWGRAARILRESLGDTLHTGGLLIRSMGEQREQVGTPAASAAALLTSEQRRQWRMEMEVEARATMEASARLSQERAETLSRLAASRVEAAGRLVQIRARLASMEAVARSLPFPQLARPAIAEVPPASGPGNVGTDLPVLQEPSVEEGRLSSSGPAIATVSVAASRVRPRDAAEDTAVRGRMGRREFEALMESRRQMSPSREGGTADATDAMDTLMHSRKRRRLD